MGEKREWAEARTIAAAAEYLDARAANVVQGKGILRTNTGTLIAHNRDAWVDSQGKDGWGYNRRTGEERLQLSCTRCKKLTYLSTGLCKPCSRLFAQRF